MALVLDQGLTQARLQPNVVTFGQFMPATPLSTFGPLTPNVVTFGQNEEGASCPEFSPCWGVVVKSYALSLIGMAIGAYITTRIVKKAWRGEW